MVVGHLSPPAFFVTASVMPCRGEEKEPQCRGKFLRKPNLILGRGGRGVKNFGTKFSFIRVFSVRRETKSDIDMGIYSVLRRRFCVNFTWVLVGRISIFLPLSLWT